MHWKQEHTNYGCLNRFYGKKELPSNAITDITDLQTVIADCPVRESVLLC